jgi:Uma2 family endonuclease
MPAIQAILPDETVVHVPAWVTDHASFVRWLESEEAPEYGKIGFIEGTLWVDNTMEQLLHNLIKSALTQEIRNWNRTHQLGHYYSDGMTFSNAEAEVSTIPDGIFVTHNTLEKGIVVRKKGLRSTILSGSPDLVIEVVSRSSVTKDLKQLRELYFDAGVKEYWLVDSRVDQPVLQILKRSATQFDEVVAQDGWVNSQVLEGSFRLAVNLESEEVYLESRKFPAT